MGRHEEIGIRTRRGLQSNRNTKIGKIPYSQVYPNFIITDIKENTGNIAVFPGKSNTYYATLTACTSRTGNTSTHALFDLNVAN
jgi:hypothetical protein